MRREYRSIVEQLEARTFLSVSLGAPLPLAAAPNLGAIVRSALPASSPGTGVTLNLTAGVPFTGEVAFDPTPVLDPPMGYSASIDWGNGTTTKATLQYGVEGTIGGIRIIGSNTYKNPGTFTINVTVMIGPIVTPGQPPPAFPTTIVAQITSKAVVAPNNSSRGVTINETAGQRFSANVGSFVAIAPATGLKALISWGDGVSSAGQIVASGVLGIDVIKFNVIGAHTYAKPGIYSIQIVVTKPSVGPTATPVQVVTTIASTAVVTAAKNISLAGAISGTYVMSVANPDVGKTYHFLGAGNAGALGSVTANGIVTLPGFTASGQATGLLTLVSTRGSVTLALTGPVEPGFGRFPSSLSYVITGATGAYIGDTASGVITVVLGPSITAIGANSFKFLIT